MVRNRETFGAVMPNVVTIRHTWDPAETFTRGEREKGAELADDLQRHCETYGGATIAAVFVEPVAGSTGTLVPPKGYLKRLREICDAHGILLVFDEVITGFGRLGAPFAADAFGVTPDIITHGEGADQRRHSDGRGGGDRPRARDDHRGGARGGDRVLPWLHLFRAIRPPAPPGSRRCRSTRTKAFSSGRRGCRTISSTRSGRCATCRSSATSAATGFWPASRCTRSRGSPGLRGTELQKRLFWNGCHVKWTGDTAIVAPSLVAERGHVDEIVEALRRTLAEA